MTNQILAPRVAPEHLGVRGIGCCDYFQMLARTTEQQWPDGAPVVIRASAVTPFRHIQKIFEVMKREPIGEHPLYLAVAVAE